MESIVKKPIPKNKDIKYPILMINPSTDAIVLFRNESYGTMVFQGKSMIGLGESILNNNNYIPFIGEVTLKN